MSLFRSACSRRLISFYRQAPFRLIGSKFSTVTGQDCTSGKQESESHDDTVPTSAQFQALQTELENLKDSRSELEDKYKRALAESENMRKRLMRQIEEAKIFGIRSFCKDLLDVADVLTKATETAPADQLEPGVNPPFINLFEGLKMIDQQMLTVFERHHLLRIQPKKGDRFDPNFHEAVFQAPLEEGSEPNTIAVVTKIGYKLHERTLRPAYVGVFPHEQK